MASLVNFSGIGSNIDFDVIRDAIISEKMRPVTLLQAKSTSFTNKASVLKQLNSLLTNLTTASQALTDTSLGTGRSAISSSESILGASATASAAMGGFSVSVSRLATSLTQASDSIPTVSAPILAGGATTATFELRLGGAGSGAAITIDSSNDSLTGLRDAINGANAGVTATIVDLSGTGTQNQLVLTSAATGTAGRVELVETTATGTAAALNLRSINPPGATNDFSALNAQLSINGLPISRSSNTISDAVTGVTLNLRETGSASITIGQSSDIATKLQVFASAYNSVESFMASQYTADSSGRPTGILAGDATLRMIQTQMREAMSAVSSANGGSFSRLTDIGFGRDENGKLKLDLTVLNQKLASNPDDVRSLIVGKTSGNTGIFTGVHTIFNNLSDDVTGVVQTAITGCQDSIKSLTKSIADQTQRVSELRAILTRQFSRVDAAIGQLNSQGSTLTSIITAMQSSNQNR
jgi:flagellar hook-associated protein 2